MRIILVLLWIVTLLSTCVGALTLFSAIGAQAAPAQGAAAAVACGLAVIPYVFTRAIEGMASKPRSD
jgi:hypothetical protein